MAILRYTNWDGLINAGVSDFLLQDNELVAAKNCWVYKLGKLEKCPGYTVATDSGQVINGKSVNYLHHYYDTANRVDYMLATSDEVNDLTLEYRTTGAFATIGSIGAIWDTYATSTPCMANYLGKTFIVGYKSGTTYLPTATVTGTTFAAADANMPQAKYNVVYRDLMYVLHCKKGGTVYPTRAYFGDEPTGGSVAWTGVDTNFVEFGYDDGDEITGGVEAFDRLVVFKRYSTWKYDESSVQNIGSVGCDSFRSIVKINNVPYWYNKHGIWRWNGQGIELVSRKVQPFIDAIDQNNPQNVFAQSYEGNEYRLFIGTVTVEDDTYTNAWICFNTLTEKFYIRCTFDACKSACIFVEGGKRRTYFGNDNGYVMKFATPIDKIYADNGNQIDSFFITKALDHGVPEYVKFTTHMVAFTNYAADMKCSIEADNSSVYNESNFPLLEKNVAEADFAGSANRFRYRFYEKGSGKSWNFEGFTLETAIKEED